MVQVMTSQNWESLVSTPGIVIVDCWAPWCAACKTFTPMFERAAENHPDHLFAKLDTEEEEGLVREFEIAHIPTLMLFRDGILVFQQPSNFGEEDLEGIMTQSETLDMDEVRAKITAREES